MQEDESEEDGNESEVRQSFRDFLFLIAKNSDVKIATAENVYPSSRSLCLPSEQKSVAPVGISISMSRAIVNLVKSWFEDFEKRLVMVEKVKLKSYSNRSSSNLLLAFTRRIQIRSALS